MNISAPYNDRTDTKHISFKKDAISLPIDSE